MSDDAPQSDPRIDEILDRYEGARAAGERPSPEALCLTAPELLEEVSRRIVALEAFERFLGPDADPRDATDIPSPASSSPGGRFRTLRLLAQGGLGEVHLALDEELQREVALKRLRDAAGARPDARARFLREALITARLEHPGIIPIHGLGVDASGRAYYAMRLVRGESLDAAAIRFHDPEIGPRDAGARRLALQDLLRRLVSVCQAIAYAHRRGVVHRDLKPANVMLGAFGETLVVDWGLAKAEGVEEVTGGHSVPLPDLAAEEATLPGLRQGSPGYMSPEQLGGGAIGPASDVYSLGATLYKILTGRPPFMGTLGLLDRMRRSDFPPPREIVPDVPPPLESICRAAMNPEPDRRYASALELANDIERWLADEPVSVHTDSRSRRLRRWVRRNWSRVVAGLSAAAVAAIALIVLVILQSRSSRRLEASNRRLRASLVSEGQARAASERDRRAAETALDETEVALTAAAVHEALADLEAGRLDRARAALDRARPGPGRPDRRRLEWHLLDRRLDSAWRRFEIDGPLRMLRFDAEGIRLQIAPGLALEPTQEEDRLRGSEAAATTEVLDPAPLGSSVAAWTPGDPIAEIRLLDGRTGAEISRLPAPRSPLRGLALLGDGRSLATVGAEGSIVVRDLRSGDSGPEHATGILPLFRGLIASPSGRRIAILGDFEQSGLAFRCRLGVLDLREDLGIVSAATFGLEGRSAEFGGAMPEPAMAFDREEGQLAIALPDRSVRVLDVAAGRESRRIEGLRGPARALVFFPDGRRLAALETGCGPTILGGASPSRVELAAADRDWRHLALSTDGLWLAADAAGGLRIWPTARTEAGLLLEGGTAPVIVDAARLALGQEDGRIERIELASGRSLGRIGRSGPALTAIAASPDGRWLGAANAAGLRLIETATGRERDIAGPGLDARVEQLVFDASGERLAVAGRLTASGELRVLEVAEGRWLGAEAMPIGRPVSLAFDGPDLLVGSIDLALRGRVQRFRIETAERIALADDLQAFAFDPRSRRLALARADRIDLQGKDGTAADLRSEPLDGPPMALAFSPDGERLAAVCWDPDGRTGDRLVILDTESLRSTLELRVPESRIEGCAFSPDGAFLVTWGGGKTRVWDARP